MDFPSTHHLACGTRSSGSGDGGFMKKSLAALHTRAQRQGRTSACEGTQKDSTGLQLHIPAVQLQALDGLADAVGARVLAAARTARTHSRRAGELAEVGHGSALLGRQLVLLAQ